MIKDIGFHDMVSSLVKMRLKLPETFSFSVSDMLICFWMVYRLIFSQVATPGLSKTVSQFFIGDENLLYAPSFMMLNHKRCWKITV